MLDVKFDLRYNRFLCLSVTSTHRSYSALWKAQCNKPAPLSTTPLRMDEDNSCCSHVSSFQPNTPRFCTQYDYQIATGFSHPWERNKKEQTIEAVPWCPGWSLAASSAVNYPQKMTVIACLPSPVPQLPQPGWTPAWTLQGSVSS